MENPKLVNALKDVTFGEVVAAERLADALLTIAYLRHACNPTEASDQALDAANDDCKLISDALDRVKRGAKTCTDR